MAKKRGTNRSQRPTPKSTNSLPELACEPGPESNDLEAAAAGVSQAREALGRAETAFRAASQRASEKASRVRGLTLGDVIDGTAEFVRRHPKFGVVTAAAIGFLLGRSSRR